MRRFCAGLLTGLGCALFLTLQAQVVLDASGEKLTVQLSGDRGPDRRMMREAKALNRTHHITELRLSGLKGALPCGLYSFEDLSTLEVYGESGSLRISGRLNKLKGLEYLKISAGLAHIPDKVRLPKLKTLDLSWNNLDHFPRFVLGSPDLQALFLLHNSIPDIPGDIDHLGSLRFLNMESNALGSLPPEIGGCTHLEELILNDNDLHALPSSLCDLRHLRRLHVLANSLSAFPACIPQQDHLEEFWLDIEGGWGYD